MAEDAQRERYVEMKRAAASVMILCALVLALPAGASMALQDSAVTVVLDVSDWVSGEPLTDACFVLQDASNEGCDENGDGTIRFADVLPGPYLVIQTQGIDGYLPVGDFPIVVESRGPEQFFPVQIAADTSSSATADVAIKPFDTETDDTVTGQCFIFNGGSEEGCDDNDDGWVEFDDLPVGSYLVSHTQTTAGFALSADEWFGITGDGYGRFPVSAQATDGGDPEIPDIGLITRDPKSAKLLEGACYVLIDFSNEGCDENEAGRVEFKDVPAGIYEVDQTTAPGDEDLIERFTIEVIDEADEQGIVVKQERFQTDEDHRHVSVLFQDPYTGELVKGVDVCIELANADYRSNKGCDDNEDGQVDFLDVPLGTYEVELEVDNLPPGSELVYGPMTIGVEATDASAIVVLSTLRIVAP